MRHAVIVVLMLKGTTGGLCAPGKLIKLRKQCDNAKTQTYLTSQRFTVKYQSWQISIDFTWFLSGVIVCWETFLFLSNLTVWCSFTQSNKLPIPQQTQAQNPRSLLLSNFQWSCQLGTNAGRQRSQHLSSPTSLFSSPVSEGWRPKRILACTLHTPFTVPLINYQTVTRTAFSSRAALLFFHLALH